MKQPYPGDGWFSDLYNYYADIYVQARTVVDAGIYIWISRAAFDIGDGLDKEQSKNKHADELKAALGLTGNPNKAVAVSHKQLPPFDRDDLFGAVHVVLPPEQFIPPQADIMFWRGDIAGVTLTETPPFVAGANTTPREMVMSFLLHLYDRVWQDKILAAHAERGYTHFHLSVDSSNDLFAYVQSLGFWTSYWDINANKLLSLGNLAEKSIIIIGNEVNSKMSPEVLLGVITNISKTAHAVGAKVGIHFTSNIPSWQPNSWTPFEWWNSLNGKIDFLCWQGNQDDSAGKMGASLWDARVRVANNARVVAFELLATNQLFGKATEEYGCLRGYEMLCCTRTLGSNIAAVSGFGNGARYPDGSVI